jgi:two-component system, OmpR family, response regulator
LEKNIFVPVIFIIDKDNTFLKITQQYLTIAGYPDTLIFSDYSECLPYLDLEPDIIITEFFGETASVSSNLFFKIVKDHTPNTLILFFSSSGHVNEVVNLMHQGAVDYIVKSKSAFTLLIRQINNIVAYKRDVFKNKRSSKRIAASIGILAVLTGFLVVMYNM